MPMLTGNWKNYTDSDGLKPLKTDHLLTYKMEKNLSAWIPGLTTLKMQGGVPL